MIPYLWSTFDIQDFNFYTFQVPIQKQLNVRLEDNGPEPFKSIQFFRTNFFFDIGVAQIYIQVFKIRAVWQIMVESDYFELTKMSCINGMSHA